MVCGADICVVFAAVLAMQTAPQLATGDPLAKDLSEPVHYERLSGGPITLVEADGMPRPMRRPLALSITVMNGVVPEKILPSVMLSLGFRKA